MFYYRNIWDVIDEVDQLEIIPTADAILPIAPQHIPAWYLGQSMGCNDINLADRGMVPFHNLGFVHDYISSSSTQKEYACRIKTVLEDTAMVNTLCGLGDQIGAFSAGAFVNAKVEHYLREMEQSVGKEYEVHEEFEQSLNNLYSGHKKDAKWVNRVGVGVFNEYAYPKTRRNPFTFSDFVRAEYCGCGIAAGFSISKDVGSLEGEGPTFLESYFPLSQPIVSMCGNVMLIALVQTIHKNYES